MRQFKALLKNRKPWPAFLMSYTGTLPCSNAWRERSAVSFVFWGPRLMSRGNWASSNDDKPRCLFIYILSFSVCNTTHTVDRGSRSFILLANSVKKTLFSPSIKPRGWQQPRHSVAPWKGLCLWRGLLKSPPAGTDWSLAGLCCCTSALQMDCWKARRFICAGLSPLCPQYPDLGQTRVVDPMIRKHPLFRRSDAAYPIL